jgi:negative regulator of sigma E activity
LIRLSVLPLVAREQVQLLRRDRFTEIRSPALERVVPREHRAELLLPIDRTQHIGLRADLLDEADHQLESQMEVSARVDVLGPNAEA